MNLPKWCGMLLRYHASKLLILLDFMVFSQILLRAIKGFRIRCNATKIAQSPTGVWIDCLRLAGYG